jgi:7,8-dihydropterin-6-yl-methyl-4-(beta-D-ribofuranosyl)aminobenzene 5'-phosphate synthase
MQIKVLVDNNTIIDRYFLAEPAVSYLITINNTKILFDVGYSDIFIQNAKAMGEDLFDIDYIVISHGHNDHTGGLAPLIAYYSRAKEEGIKYKIPTIVAHPKAFCYKEYEGLAIGSLVDKKRLKKHFSINLTKKPLQLTNNLIFLGEIKRDNDFENQEPLGIIECKKSLKKDYLKDDSALAYKAQDGLVIITGCSHAGICNIIEHAKKVCSNNKILDIIGGFHLLNPSKKQSTKTLNYFKEQNINTIHPCHCTSLDYKIKLSKYSNIKDVGVGLELDFK